MWGQVCVPFKADWFMSYLMTLYELHNVEWQGEFQNFLGETEEYHENLSEWPVFRLRFKPDASKIQSRNDIYQTINLVPLSVVSFVKDSVSH
jgi:hypothetical protein